MGTNRRKGKKGAHGAGAPRKRKTIKKPAHELYASADDRKFIGCDDVCYGVVIKYGGNKNHIRARLLPTGTRKLTPECDITWRGAIDLGRSIDTTAKKGSKGQVRKLKVSSGQYFLYAWGQVYCFYQDEADAIEYNCPTEDIRRSLAKIIGGVAPSDDDDDDDNEGGFVFCYDAPLPAAAPATSADAEIDIDAL